MPGRSSFSRAAKLSGMSPKGFIVSQLDTVLVSSAIIMEVPMVDDVESTFYTAIHEGDRIRLDAAKGQIEIL